MQGAHIMFGGNRLMAIAPGQGMVIDPTGNFSAAFPDCDVWRLLPIPTSESLPLNHGTADASCGSRGACPLQQQHVSRVPLSTPTRVQAATRRSSSFSFGLPI
jgi:hypothetical protein